MSRSLFALPTSAFSSRREFLLRAGNGFGSLALAGLLSQEGGLASAATGSGTNPLAPRPGHFPGKAKSVIWLFMNGGPSQVDTWDYKPELEKRDGKELAGFDQTTGFFAGQGGPLMKSPFKFHQHGECGAWVSEIFPKMATHVDKMAFVYSCWTDSNNHSPALFKINTGMSRQGFPCAGSWVTYGLGSESQNLPAFVVMYDTLGRGGPKGHAQNWGAGFLPSVFQGTALKPQGDPIENLRRSTEMTDAQQRSQLDLLSTLNRQHLERHSSESELAARIESFELAYRMQSSAAEVVDVERETAATQSMYGLDDPLTAEFGRKCLVARRLVEQGVRFIQIYSGGGHIESTWDGHNDCITNHKTHAGETDRPIAALIADLKQRGLWDETLIVWGGEFGRTATSEGIGKPGRDHNWLGFSMWLAGGGVKGGQAIGATDDLGFQGVADRVHVSDLHATILRLMGFDHRRLSYFYNGLDQRLTGVEDHHVVEKALA